MVWARSRRPYAQHTAKVGRRLWLPGLSRARRANRSRSDTGGKALLPRQRRESIGGYSRVQPGSPEHKLGVAWETSLDALLVVDDERRCVCINQPAIGLLGAPVEEVLNRRLEDFIPQEHRADLERLWAAWEDQGCQLGACQVLRGDGSRSTVEYRATWDYGPGQHLIAARPVGARRPETGPRPRPAAPALTRREREVLQLAADGRSVAEIAERLFLSPGTVRTHLQNIHKKLGVRDRASAVAAGLRTGLIE